MVLHCLYTFLPLSLQALNRGKGLLPEPNVMQILTGLSNPATLNMLLASLNPGHNQGTYAHSFSFVGCFLFLIQAVNVTLLSICRPAGSCARRVSAGKPWPLCCPHAAAAPEPSPTGTVPFSLNPTSPATVPAACVLALILFFSPPSKFF